MSTKIIWRADGWHQANGQGISFRLKGTHTPQPNGPLAWYMFIARQADRARVTVPYYLPDELDLSFDLPLTNGHTPTTISAAEGVAAVQTFLTQWVKILPNGVAPATVLQLHGAVDLTSAARCTINWRRGNQNRSLFSVQAGYHPAEAGIKAFLDCLNKLEF